MSKLVCIKAYSGIPFAHRAPFHDGHCRFVHGHNWGFVFTFKSITNDINNFVFDFGKLKELKADLCKLVILPSTSCEGIAEYFLNKANDIVGRNSNGRVACINCKVIEDENNSATYGEE